MTLGAHIVHDWVVIYGYDCNLNRHSAMSAPHPTIRAAGSPLDSAPVPLLRRPV